MRLIDANRVVKDIISERDKIPYELVSEKPFKHENSMRGGIRKALRCVEQAPTVDAVPVVRCAKCEHWVKNDDGQCVCALFDIANSYGEPVVTKPDDFCSYGKRKGEVD